MLRVSKGDYANYYQRYIDLLPAEDIILQLENQKSEFLQFLQQMPEGKWDYAYAPEKWTVKEVLGHLVDSEIIFGYRALCLARGEQENLLGYEENAYVKQGLFASQSYQLLVNLWLKARETNLLMFQSFSPQSWENQGLADHNVVKAKGIPFIIAGHLKHHLQVVEERYL